MTDEEIIELAEQSGGENINGNLFYMCKTDLKSFADSVRLAEREACAKACEAEAVDASVSPEDAAYNAALSHAAESIRARSTKEG